MITGTVFLFDANRNLVTTPQPVKFDLTVAGGQPQSRTVQSKDGVAYIKLDSGRKAGPAQFVATAGNASVRRVVEETASDPCNLRIHAQPNKNGVTLETDPVKDCAGNPVPDGTIVTFTANGPQGRSTVDARIKKGVAKAELPPASVQASSCEQPHTRQMGPTRLGTAERQRVLVRRVRPQVLHGPTFSLSLMLSLCKLSG